MNTSAPCRVAARGRARSVWPSALAALLVAATPKCPLCAAAMMSALGVGSIISSTWLRPLAVALLLLSVGALFLRARRTGAYGPFGLGLAAAAAICLCKFGVGHDAGVYLGGAALLAASIWNAAARRLVGSDARCGCESHVVALERRGVAGTDTGV